MDPGFGTAFTDHMATARWDEQRGWHDAAIVPYAAEPMDPATSGLHYGQVVFEGLKAFRQPDGTAALFRPDYHARRLGRSAGRLAMPLPPPALVVSLLESLVRADHAWLPDQPGHSLYLRPLLYATEPALGLRPASSYRMMVIAFACSPMLGTDPVSVWICDDQVRAAPGGTGDIKAAGNYAAGLAAHARATAEGCQQAVWLDAVERRWVEEMGTMNLFFGWRSGRLTTPPLGGTILAGATRDSLLALARDAGYHVAEEPLSVHRWQAACLDGSLAETFACGTAATVVPIGAVRSAAADWTIGDGGTGPVTAALRDRLLDVQFGRAADPHGWRHPVSAAELVP